MMAARSAGILLYRFRDARPEVLLAHPGGPFWQGKDEGAWAIPKGEIHDGEETEAAARREFREETGLEVNSPLLALGRVRQRGGKVVEAFAAEGDVDPGAISSNTFSLEWPPRSGQLRRFPEIDQAAWFALRDARRKILPSQAFFLKSLASCLGLCADGE